MSTPWILDLDTTVKCLYGKQEGAVVGYNPHKPGRPSHSYHSAFMANTRLALGVDKLVSEDATRRALMRIDESAGLAWLSRYLAQDHRAALEHTLDPGPRHHGQVPLWEARGRGGGLQPPQTRTPLP